MTRPSTTDATAFTEDVRRALAEVCARHGINADADVLTDLASVVATCAPEVPSTHPADCRWVVTDGHDYLEGHDHLAGALDAATTVTSPGEPDTIRIKRNTY